MRSTCYARICIVCGMAYRRRSSGGRGTRAPSCCACSPATPRSRSCTSRPTPTPGALGGRRCSRRWRRHTRPRLVPLDAGRPRRPRRRVPRPAARPVAGIAAPLVDTVAHVVDLGADFRLPVADYEQWYGEAHTAPELHRAFAFGLPELYRAEIARRAHVASPGCYPTAASLALAPLLAAGLVEPTGIVVDAVSGVSGAGRGAEGHEPLRRGRTTTSPPTACSRTATPPRWSRRSATCRRPGAGAVHAAPRADDARASSPPVTRGRPSSGAVDRRSARPLPRLLRRRAVRRT